MPPTLFLILILTLPLLLAASAFFSASETALFSLTRHQRRQMARRRDIIANAVQTLLDETRSLLITLLLGNTAVNVTYFVVTAVLLIEQQRGERLGGLGASVISVSSLFLLILLGEVAPKVIASRVPVACSRAAALPLLAVHRAISPVRITLGTIIVAPLSRLFSPRPRAAQLSIDEMSALLQMSQERGLIDPGEERMLQHVVALGTLKVRDIMTPRVDLTAFTLNDAPSKLTEIFLRGGQSYVPVYRQDIDHIEGIAYARQTLLRRPQNPSELRPLIRQVMFVPEIQRADRLLVQFRKTGATVAIAVDEFGGTAGMVTLEDVVARLVGQAPGGDRAGATPTAQLVELGVWRADADLSVHDWTRAFGSRVSEPGVSTLGGLVIARLGRSPRKGDKVRLGNLLIEIEGVTHRRIDSLLLRLLPDSQEPPTRPQIGGATR